MGKTSFRLRGKNYRLHRREVEQKLKPVTPGRVDKYYVTVNGRRYSPKQVVATTLDITLISFTTMDANRILSGLGFDVERVENEKQPSKTESELLFEEYLNSSGLLSFHFEKEFEHTPKRPDYSVPFHGKEILFDMKEFRADADDFKPGGGTYDPYKPVREKINAARKKFQDFKEHCCCLVLYNREKPLVDLKWQFIYGAMLGNLAIQMPVDLKRDRILGEPRSVYGGGGKMIRYEGENPLEPQNTTISAILTLEQLNVGKRRFDSEIASIEQKQGRHLTLEEHQRAVENARDISMRQLRVVVQENPFARHPVPQEMFCGPYDERYGLVEAQIERIFAGAEIVKHEERVIS